jgi:hypothetical protein
LPEELPWLITFLGNLLTTLFIAYLGLVMISEGRALRVGRVGFIRTVGDDGHGGLDIQRTLEEAQSRGLPVKLIIHARKIWLLNNPTPMEPGEVQFPFIVYHPGIQPTIDATYLLELLRERGGEPEPATATITDFPKALLKLAEEVATVEKAEEFTQVKIYAIVSTWIRVSPLEPP